MYFDKAGGILGGAGGSALLGALGRVAEPLDYPRRALWNVPGKLARGDVVGALPGLAGLAAGGLTAATGFGLPFAATVGSLVGGLGQGVGEALAPERFHAPSPEDVTGSDNPVVNLLVGAAGDPLSFAGGLGGARLGSKAGRWAEESSPLLKALAAEDAGAARLPRVLGERDATAAGVEAQYLAGERPSAGFGGEAAPGGKAPSLQAAPAPKDAEWSVPFKVPATPRREPWEENPWAVLAGHPELGPTVEGRFPTESAARGAMPSLEAARPLWERFPVHAPGMLPREFEREVIAPKYGMLGDLAQDLGGGLVRPEEARDARYGLWDDVLRAEQRFHSLEQLPAFNSVEDAARRGDLYGVEGLGDLHAAMRDRSPTADSLASPFGDVWRNALRQFTPEQVEAISGRYYELLRDRDLAHMATPSAAGAPSFLRMSPEEIAAMRQRAQEQFGGLVERGRTVHAGVSGLHPPAIGQYHYSVGNPIEDAAYAATHRPVWQMLTGQLDEGGAGALLRALEAERFPIDPRQFLDAAAGNRARRLAEEAAHAPH